MGGLGGLGAIVVDLGPIFGGPTAIWGEGGSWGDLGRGAGGSGGHLGNVLGPSWRPDWRLLSRDAELGGPGEG